MEKVYSYSYAKFLEDKGLAEVLAVGLTIEEVTRDREKEPESISGSRKPSKTIKAIEKAEFLLKILKSSGPMQVIRRNSNLDFMKIRREEKQVTDL